RVPMQFKVILRIIGLLMMVFSVTMLPPIAISQLFGDDGAPAFLKGFLITLASGAALWLPFRTGGHDLRQRDGFLIVALFWLILGTVGALPFLLADTPDMTPTDAIFEAISGFTTTGATVLSGLDQMPRSILYYRQQLHWFGGMGIVVLAVAIMPMLGIGGMQLYKAETPGPVKDTKLTPRIAETAKSLWMIYFGITALCAGSYWLAGMDWFDALGHSFATVATGGYSTHDASLGYFNSPTIEMVSIFFMLISGINFTVHFLALQKLSTRVYLLDREVCGYIVIIVLAGLLISSHLIFQGAGKYSIGDSVRHGIFHVVSFITTTGFTTTDFYNWPGFTPVLLIFICFIGGCAGSTSGGLKVIRVILLYKQGMREITRLIHPNAWVPVKIGGNPLSYRVVDAVWGFFALYVVSFGVMMLLMMETGLDQVTAFSAIATCINNTGPGLGEVTTTFATLSDPAKWLSCIAMVLGRLEIYTVLVLLSPAYWRG
ncbi:MAG: TrkH family potassium uptake protein, partial [Methylococcales bacterium]